MIVKKVSVAANVNIGALTDKRIRLLNGLLEKDFPTRDPNAPAGLVVIRHDNKGTVAMVTQTQIVIAQASQSLLQPANIDLQRMQKHITEIFEADFLALDPTAQIAFTIEGIEHQDFLVGKRSKEKLSITDKDILGIGIRVMIDGEEYAGDYRVEPFIPDPFYSFYELQVLTKQPVDVSKLEDLTAKMLERFHNSYKSCADLILSD